MTDTQPTTRHAAKLVYKSLVTSITPLNDLEYRQLLAAYRAYPAFSEQVHAIAEGLELLVLDVSERGLVVVPATKESKFALRMLDFRTALNSSQKAALVLAHVAVAATFFPTAQSLEDDAIFPPPASVADFRDLLLALAKRLKEVGNDEVELPQSLELGWELICSLPVSRPGDSRANVATVVGFLSTALKEMVNGGLVRPVRGSDDDSAVTYTPTNRFRVQLRELSMRRLFELAQQGSTSTLKKA